MEPFTSVAEQLMSYKASQVETLFEVLEELDPKLKALGVVTCLENQVRKVE